MAGKVRVRVTVTVGVRVRVTVRVRVRFGRISPAATTGALPASSLWNSHSSA